MEKENLFKTVGPSLRSVVLSSKGGVFLDGLERDYKELLGSPIPYRKMGFDTLEAMLRAMPDVVKVVKDSATRRSKVIAVADESTEHIQKMIARQRDSKSSKSSTSSKRFRVSNSRASSYNQRRPYRSGPPTPQRRVLLETPPYKPQNNARYSVNVRVPSSRSSPRRDVVSSRPPWQQQQLQQEPANRRKGFVLSTTNHEVPPRFLRQQKFEVRNDYKAEEQWDPLPAARSQPPTFPVPPAPLPYAKAPSSTPAIAGGAEVSSSPSPRAITASVNIPDPVKPPGRALVRGAAHSAVTQPQPKQQQKTKRPPAVQPPLPSQLSAKDKVKQYADANNLEVMYKTKMTKAGYFLSSLQLGDKKFLSVRAENHEKRTEQEAEELAASMALEYIDEEKKKKFPVTSLSSSENIQTFVARIEMIVSEKTSGVWSCGLQNEYENRYKESLPESWLSVIQSHSSIIECERSENVNIPKNACILRIARTSSGTTTPTSTSSRTSFCLDEDQHHQILPYINSESSGGSTRVPPLVFPEDMEWPVYVCCVASAIDISVRLCEHSDEFHDMVGKMNAYYMSNGSPIHRVIINKAYAAFDEGSWHRVVVEEIHDSNQAVCNFVDFGLVSIKPFSDLRELDPSFETMPFQAIHIKLHDLEDLFEIIDIGVLELLLDQTFIAKVHQRHPAVVAELFDTSSDIDVNLNIMLRIQTFERLMMNGCLPEVKMVGSFYLINVTGDGIISLLGTDPALDLLSAEMQRFAPLFEAGTPVEELDVNTVYAVKYPVDDSWCRALPTGFSEPASGIKPYEVEMYFIDYGNTMLVPLSSVAVLPNWLGELPRLAQECILTDIPPSPDLVWTEAVTNKLYELAPDMEPLTVRVDEAATDEVPAKVHLFKRNSNGDVISINSSLGFNPELFGKAVENSDEGLASMATPYPTMPLFNSAQMELPRPKNVFHPSTKPLSGSIPDVAVPASVVDEQIEKFGAVQAALQPASTPADESSAGIIPIPAPVIPAVKQYFDVYVAMAASPSNFVVQPLKSSKDLNRLLVDMKLFYTSEDNKCEMHPVLLKKGDFYAVHYRDGEWYRAKLTNLDPDSNVVTAHLVDFGDFVMTSMANLQPLWKQFKILPCQALKASLAGVKPRFGDWEPEECLKFREYVEEKQFVSVIVNHVPNTESDWSDVILDLMLIDTSNPAEDVYIHQQLIDNDLAVST